MTGFLVLLFLVSVAALVVGLIHPSWVKQSSRKRASLFFGGATVVFLLLIGVTAPHTSEPVASASIVEATNTAPVATSTPQADAAILAEDDIPTATDQAIAQAAITKTSATVQQIVVAPTNGKAGPDRLYPDPKLTPGAILTTDASKLCTLGYSSTVRNVSTATKKQAYAEYGLGYPQPTGSYEVDHFISLELGGSNDITNLWPEPASPTPGFHQKDQFENFEHEQICKGIITAQEAQRRMMTDWYYYYETEMLGVTPSTAPVQSATVPAPASAPQPAPATTTTASSSAAYYTSSYGTSKYYYPASCPAWKNLSAKYLVSFPSLDALLAKYPGQTLSPQCP